MPETYTSTTSTLEEMRRDLEIPDDAGSSDDAQPLAASVTTGRDAPDEDDVSQGDHKTDPGGASQSAAEPQETAPQADRAAAAPDSTSSKPEATDDEDLKDLPARAQKRIAQYRRKLGDQERKAADLEARLAQVERERKPAAPAEPAPPPQPPARPAEPEDPEPTLEDPTFADFDAWQTAHIAWQVRKGVRDTLATERQAADAKRQADEDQRRLEAAEREATAQAAALQERVSAFKADHADYDDMVAKATFSTPMVAAVALHEQGPALAYYLGQHPDEAERIAKLPGGMALLEMGRLLATALAPSPASPAAVASAPPEPQKPQKPRVSNAPPPITGVAGASAASAAHVTDDSRYEDDEKVWEAELRAATGRR